MAEFYLVLTGLVRGAADARTKIGDREPDRRAARMRFIHDNRRRDRDRDVEGSPTRPPSHRVRSIPFQRLLIDCCAHADEDERASYRLYDELDPSSV